MKPFETLTYRGQLRPLRRLAIEALKAYQVYEPHLTALLHEDNTTFRVDAANGERYVLRIHRPTGKTVAQVRSEMLWLMFLCPSNIGAEKKRDPCHLGTGPAFMLHKQMPPITVYSAAMPTSSISAICILLTEPPTGPRMAVMRTW